MAKIWNFDSFGAVFSHFCPVKREIWHGGGPLPVPGEQSAPRAKFHVYRRNLSPQQGEQPIFEALSKNNTGMAAIRR